MITHCLPYTGSWSIITDGYPFKNMTHQKTIYSHFSASIYVFLNNTHKKQISLITLQLSADKHCEYKTLLILKTQMSPAATAYLHNITFFALLNYFTSNPHCMVVHITVQLHKTIIHTYVCRTITHFNHSQFPLLTMKRTKHKIKSFLMCLHRKKQSLNQQELTEDSLAQR